MVMSQKLELPANRDLPAFEINILPFQAQDFTLANAGEQIHQVHPFKGMALDGLKELRHLFILQWGNLRIAPLG